MIKKIISIIIFPFEVTAKGFYNLCLLLSKGFYFYFYCFFNLLSKVFKSNIFNRIKIMFKKLQNNPISFLLLVVLFFGYIFFARYGYTSNDVKVYVDAAAADDDDDSVVENLPDSKTNDSRIITNLFNKYGSYKTSDINISKLKEINKDTVGWIVVDGTSINYPIVLGNDNDYYLSHDFNKDYSIGGWIFMDYRNTTLMEDKNTIIYGHNLFNKTAFGGLSNLFTDSWFNESNHKIIIYTEKGKYIYKIFSVYNSDPETYYLNVLFKNNDEYSDFLTTLKSRSVFDFGEELNSNDRILTLSTCSDDNSGRKVIHAKLVN